METRCIRDPFDERQHARPVRALLSGWPYVN